MRFEVLENGKPASYKRWSIANYKTREYRRRLYEMNWRQHEFNSMLEAVAHARSWLGNLSKIIPDGWLGTPLRFTDRGDTIEIKIHK